MTEYKFEIKNKTDKKNADELDKYKLNVESYTPTDLSDYNIVHWLKDTTDIKFLRKLRAEIIKKKIHRCNQYCKWVTKNETKYNYAKHFHTEYQKLDEILSKIIYVYEKIKRMP